MQYKDYFNNPLYVNDKVIYCYKNCGIVRFYKAIVIEPRGRSMAIKYYNEDNELTHSTVWPTSLLKIEDLAKEFKIGVENV